MAKPEGWIAKGLLQPLWRKYEGGRDALAKKVGTSASTLSSINTANRGRRLGYDLGQRLANELRVSILELGAPEDAADERGMTLVDRLEQLEGDAATLAEKQLELTRRVDRMDARLRTLEARPWPGEDGSMAEEA